MPNDILEKFRELDALYSCYTILDNSSLGENQSVSGKLAIYEKMIEILSSDEIYPIVADGVQYPFEDYIHHVKEDTPLFLEKLQVSLSDNKN